MCTPYHKGGPHARHAPDRARVRVPMSCAVICTLGPSCRDVETLVQLLEAGMTAARIDLTVSTSHNLHTSGCMAWPVEPHKPVPSFPLLTQIGLCSRMSDS